MEKCLIGIDIGTTGTKSMLISEHGEIIAHTYAGYSMTAPMLNQHEQNAEDWWEAVVKTVRALLPNLKASQYITAISLSTQGGTLVPVDKEFNPLRPAIVWSDTRCEEERLEFIEDFGSQYMYENSGWHLSRGLNALQIAWLRKNEPDIFNQAALFLSVHDFISSKMTGKPVVDISNAGINQMADIRKVTYDPAILKFVGIDESQLPQIVGSGTLIGELTTHAAEELGLPEHVLLVAGAHDQYAALLGAGVTDASDVLIGSGTAWVVTVLSDQPDFSTGFSQSVSAVPDKWGMLVSLSTGGVCLDWLLKKIISSDKLTQETNYEIANKSAADIQPGSGGLMFFPYFNGAVFPVSDIASKASFLGLDLSHNKEHMIRSVMEGVACHISWIIEYFRIQVGEGTLRLSGGAAKSELWSQIVADMTNQVVHIPILADLPCIGAAILAGVGSGAFKDVSQGYRLFSKQERTIHPNPDNVRFYEQFQAVYRPRAKQLADLYRL